jgi:hypothetical protein
MNPRTGRTAQSLRLTHREANSRAWPGVTPLRRENLGSCRAASGVQ